MVDPFGKGKVFVIQAWSVKEDGSFVINWALKKLIELGYHYSGAQKIWGSESARDYPDADPGDFLAGMRLQHIQGHLADIDMYDNVTYLIVQDSQAEMIEEALGIKPAFQYIPST